MVDGTNARDTGDTFVTLRHLVAFDPDFDIRDESKHNTCNERWNRQTAGGS